MVVMVFVSNTISYILYWYFYNNTDIWTYLDVIIDLKTCASELKNRVNVVVVDAR
jgi:ABC-type enterochelin transport system ATPase subunit